MRQEPMNWRERLTEISHKESACKILLYGGKEHEA